MLFLSGFFRSLHAPYMLANCCVYTRLFLTAESAAVRVPSSCWWAHVCLQFGALSVRCHEHLCTSLCGRVPSVLSGRAQQWNTWANGEMRVNILRNTWSGDLISGSPCPSTRCRHWIWWVFLTLANGGKRMTSHGQCASCAAF